MGRLSAARGCHCHRRAACSTAASANATSVTTPGGASTHSASARPVTARVAPSNPRCIVILSPGFTPMVKAGTTRPAITHSIITISARPAYSARTGARFPAPRTARWNSALATDSSTRIPTNGRLRRLCARSRICRSTAATTGSSAASSTAYTAYGAATAATRAASQSSARPASAAPRGVASPVQAFTAVNKKPTITAVANPNSISWACHSSGATGRWSWMPPSSAATQTGTATQASSAAPR